MLPNFGPMELIVVLIIALLVLGPKRLPAAGRGLGRGLREFRRAVTGADDRAIATQQPDSESATQSSAARVSDSA